jgi:two-component system sensor histidine kinase HydH
VKLGLPPDTGLARRLAWITGLRLALFTLLLAATAFLYLGHGRLGDSFSLRLLLGVIGTSYILGLGYAWVLRRGQGLESLAMTQLALDQITWTAIVYVTGGATSGATAFYALSCLLGAVLIGPRGAIFGAAIGLMLYGLLCAGFALGALVPPPDQSPLAYLTSAQDVVYPVLVNTLGIVAVAVLAGYLAARLRTAGGALEQANQRAADAERLAVLGRIAAGLAHEIRNPLGSISGSIEMLGESPSLDEDDRRLCDIVRRETARLNQLVTDMMDLARPRPPSPERVDVAALAREVVALAGRNERSGTGDVSVLYEGPLGAAYARCDGAQMRQVLWNLVRNAVQASGAGEQVHVRVRSGGGEADVRTERRSLWPGRSLPAGRSAALVRRVELEVEDHGPGIAEDVRDRLFDSFVSTRTGGAGLGLAVVKRIVDDHAPFGVQMDIDSSAGRGARFRLSLQDAG